MIRLLHAANLGGRLVQSGAVVALDPETEARFIDAGNAEAFVPEPIVEAVEQSADESDEANDADSASSATVDPANDDAEEQSEDETTEETPPTETAAETDETTTEAERKTFGRRGRREDNSK